MNASCRSTLTRCSNAGCIFFQASCSVDEGVLRNDPSSNIEPVAAAARQRTRKFRSTAKPRSAILPLKVRSSARAAGHRLHTCARARSARVSGVPRLLTRLKMSTTSSTL